MITGFIKGILSCEEYPRCVNCRAKLTLQPFENQQQCIECSKCRVKMYFANCDVACVARVMLQSASDKSTLTATMFDDVVTSILSLVSVGASTSEKLLLAPILKYQE